MTATFNDAGMTVPRVSVGMPVYNGEDHVAEAIESVLSQTFSDFELIICDNASTDRTEAICREYSRRDPRVRYYRNAQNIGLAGNFARAFDLSRGEFFKWMAHDDIIAPTYILRCVEMFEQSPPSVILCFPQRVQISYQGEKLRGSYFRPWHAINPPYDRIGFAHLMCLPGHRFPGLVFGVARREVWAKTKLIQPIMFSDAVLVTELRLLGEFREIPELLFFNRQHLDTPTFRRQRGTIAGTLQNYDPANRRVTTTRAGALMTLLKARFGLVRRSSLPAYRKAVYMTWVVAGHAVICAMSLWDALKRCLWYPFEKAWESLSATLIRGSENSCLFHRVWVLLAGFRHFKPDLVSLALSPPTDETRDRLREYVTKRLQSRRDDGARQALTDEETRRLNVGRNNSGDLHSRVMAHENERFAADDKIGSAAMHRRHTMCQIGDGDGELRDAGDRVNYASGK
jgi:glycosyltransferase involved in cell wall biosynthesis